MSLSDSSSDLSTPPLSDTEPAAPPKKTLKLKHGKLTFSAKRKATPTRESSPEEPEREPSPPHDYVLADNSDIAFIVMFRARFSDSFPKNVPNLGPQDIERGVSGTEPGEHIENLLCALIGLLLNRKKYVERGHHGRALEEAISSQKSQWPRAWNGINPLHGNNSFSTMTPVQRLTLLKTLILWSLNTSEVISGIIKESYKQSRRDDDVNQPLSVQPWGMDGRKRKYFLIEGQTDTPFRVYRESAPKSAAPTWWSVAGTLPELHAVEQTLREDKSQAAKRLADRMVAAIPTLEATEEKRKRKEYRKAQRQKFVRPEPGFSLYEGRTRGKRMKYTFSDEESDEGTDGPAARRSTRQSGTATPAEASGPTYTASGRQVRSRLPRYGDPTNTSEKAPSEGLENGQNGEARATRSGRPTTRKIVDEDDEDEDMSDENQGSGGDDWAGEDSDVEGKPETNGGDDEDDDEAMSDNESRDSLMDEPKNLVVKLRYRTTNGADPQVQANGNAHAASNSEQKATQRAEHRAFDVSTEREAVETPLPPSTGYTPPPQPSNFGPQLPTAQLSQPPSTDDSGISVLPPILASSAHAQDLLHQSESSTSSITADVLHSASPSLPTKLSTATYTGAHAQAVNGSMASATTTGPNLEGPATNGLAQSSAVGPVLDGPAPLPLSGC